MKLLNTAEVAQMLSIKPNTLAIWRMQGKGPRYRKIGKPIRYTPEAVDEFIGSHPEFENVAQSRNASKPF